MSLPGVERTTLVCPQCSADIPGDTRTCPDCGVDLALIALLAERASLAEIPPTGPVEPPPQAFVPRIGEYLIDKGLLTPEQLHQALVHQSEMADEGRRLLLGQTLVEMGLVDTNTLDEAITGQIVELHAALQESNRSLEERVSERTAELRQALERLTEVNQLKTNLISNVSHELRTPLAHVKGYVELLNDGDLGPLNDDQAKAIDVVGRAALRLERLIEDLISFSTASREGMAISPVAVMLPQVSRTVVDRSQEKAKEAGVTLALAVDDNLPSVYADQDKLSWVLYQLIDNAIKFTDEGGKVRLWAEPIDLFVTVAVSDTGIGIPASKIDEIFEPFHQLDGSATRRYGGTGLGLALVKQILDAHGATIRVESREDFGSTFRFELPFTPDGQ